MATALGPSNLAVYVCDHVFDKSRPVLFVSRAGGDWQFLCGENHPEGAIPHVVGLGHLVDRDPTLLELARLPEGWEAERASVDEAWRESPSEADG
jgi:hypothetical protein